MKNLQDQIAKLQRQANALPYCPARVALFEEAVALADSAQDVDLAFRLRNDLMTAANFSGRPDLMLVAFSWCLAQYDRDPERFSRRDILWKYKWVITFGLKFPEISRPRLEALLDDMERRYREAGSTMFAVSSARREVLIEFGEMQRAREAHEEYRKRRRDALSDCPACVAWDNCRYFCWQQQWDQAVEAAQPVLQGKLRCTEEPHRVLGIVLLPLLYLGRLEEAKTCHRQGYRLVIAAGHFVRVHADHLRFAVLTGDFAHAKQFVERHLPGALEIVIPYERFQFFLAARLWADRLASQGTRTLKVRLPEGTPAPDPNGESDVAALGEWFTAQAQQIARRYDKRNGTDAYQKQIDSLPELLRLATDARR